MDRQQFAQLMNEDLGTEYRSIVQYNQHIATLKGLEVQSLLGELRQHLTQELNHAVVWRSRSTSWRRPNGSGAAHSQRD